MRLSSLLVLLVLPACAINPPEPGSEAAASAQPVAAPEGMRRVPGLLSQYGDGPVVDVPATARVGEAFTATVTTYGGGCTREDVTPVTVKGLEADVRPYQLVPVDQNTPCTRELRITPRPVSITFATAGRATVRVRGRTEPGDSAIVVTRTVEVQ